MEQPLKISNLKGLFYVGAEEAPLPPVAMAEGGSSYIPSWDGAEVSFKDFQRACDLLVIGTKGDDHGLLGGRVASRLGGAAWEWGEALDKTRLAQKDGVQYLLDYMESCLKGAKVATVLVLVLLTDSRGRSR